MTSPRRWSAPLPSVPNATTTERATYWYTCANCGEVSTEKFFYYGDVLPTEPTKPSEPKPTEPEKPHGAHKAQ